MLDYKILKYIDFISTTYINTDTYPNASTWGDVDVDLNFSLNSTQDNNLLFTTQTAGYSNTFRSIINAQNILKTVYGYNSSTQTVGTLELNRVYRYQMTRQTGNNIIPILDGVKKANNIMESNGNTTPLLLGQGNFRFYSCKITIAGILLRNFIPVKRLSDNKICLYDLISGNFFENEGSGELIEGPEIKRNLRLNIPNETLCYTKLEYIELTGTQYINTNEQLWNTSKYRSWKIEFDFEPTSAFDYNAIFGTANGATTFESWIAADKNFYFRYNSNKQTVSNINVNTRYKFIADYSPSTLTFTINDTSKSISQSAGSIASDLYIGHRSSNYGKFKIYSLKLYGNGKLVRNFIPCKYNNQIGLWDLVTGIFFPNSGTGNFINGSEQNTVMIRYTKLDYIEATGTQWIDTKIIPVNANYKVEICYQSTKTVASNEESFIFGYWLESGKSGGWRAGVEKNTLTNTGVGFTFDNIDATKKTIATSTSATAYNSSQSPYLFSQNYKNTANTVVDGQYRLYYCKIWNGDTLVRDFIPCHYINKIGLWDKVTNIFFGNNGEGDFKGNPFEIVSKINSKYPKTFDGISVQCWKKET